MRQQPCSHTQGHGHAYNLRRLQSTPRIRKLKLPFLSEEKTTRINVKKNPSTETRYMHAPAHMYICVRSYIFLTTVIKHQILHFPKKEKPHFQPARPTLTSACASPAELITLPTPKIWRQLRMEMLKSRNSRGCEWLILYIQMKQRGSILNGAHV